MSRIFAILAQLLIGSSLFVVFYCIYYPDSLRDDWDGDETAARITRFVRQGRTIAVALLTGGVVCLALAWQHFVPAEHVFLSLLALHSAALIGYHFWSAREENLK